MTERPIRVLHVIPGLESGGAERQLLTVGRELRHRGVDQRIASMTPGGLLRPSCETTFDEVLDLGMDREAASMSAIARLHRAVSRLRPDVIHAWMYHACLIAAVAPSRVPTVWSIRHGLDAPDHLRPRTRLIVRALPLLCARARAIVFNSARSRKQHVDWGYPAGKSIVIPNGVDTSRFTPDRMAGMASRRALGIPADHRVVGYLGRLHSVKGWDLFCRAAARVLGGRQDVTFLMAGSASAAEAEALHRLSDELGTGSSLRFLGFESDVPRYLAALDVLVSPSRSEGFPNAVAEAMACGVPCVATDVADNATIIRDSGVLVQPDAESIGNGIATLLAFDAAAYSARATAARTRAVAEFASARMADALLSVYQDAGPTR